jgi:hypothetical protein
MAKAVDVKIQRRLFQSVVVTDVQVCFGHRDDTIFKFKSIFKLLYFISKQRFD